MKKHILSFFLAIIACAASAAQLNPFAYNLSSTYDEATMKLTVNWSTNAPSENIKIIVNDGTQDYIIKEYDKANYAEGYIPKNNYNSTIDVSGLPPNTELAWRIEVIGASQADNVVSLGNLIQVRMPMSIDIDNNPESPYFGRILVSQPTNNVGNNTQGVYMYTPALAGGSTLNGGTKCLPDITPSTEDWYNSLHMAPYRVRIAQDGTGTIFVSSCDVGRPAYLWKVDPANPASTDSWTRILTRDQMRTYANNLNPTTGDLLYNVGIDIREEGDNYKLALLSTSLSAAGFVCGYLYSGEYTIAKTSTTGTYTKLTQPTSVSSSHTYVSSSLIGAALNGNILYDKNGNVWYTGASIADGYTTEAGLIHKNGDSFKADYGDVFQRQYMFAGGIRYNTDFSKIIIPQGNSSSYNAAIYDVNHDGTHPTLSNRVNLPRIASGFTKARTHIMDCAWDIAGNIYICVGYVGTNYPWGVYSYATNLNGAAVSTPAAAQYAFEVACDGASHTVTAGSNDAILGSVSGGGSYESCSAVTVVATPTDKGRFIEWQNSSGESVSTDATYTFYMPNKDIELTAIFLPITYSGITWHKLLANGEDLDTNEELWELIQPLYNDYVYEFCDKHTRHNQNMDESGINTFFATDYYETDLRTCMNDDDFSFIWLREYVKSVKNITNISSYSAKQWSTEFVGWLLTQHYTNATFATTSADYSSNGKPTYWLPYYRQYICGLNSTMAYNEPMPIKINEYPTIKNGDGILATGDGRPYQLPTWYVRNHEEGKLLAWRNGSTEGEIVHHVNANNMALYATWVDKHISENQDNTDVVKLMQNSEYAYTPHTITVDRPLQASMYNTICLPFSLASLDGTPLEGATLLKFSGTSSTYEASGDPVTVLNFTEATSIEAGKPYLIQLSGEAITSDMTFSNITYDNLILEAQSNTSGTFTFHAAINPTDIPAGSLILVADNRLAVTTEDGKMKGMRGYFTIDPMAIDAQEMAAAGRVYLSMKKPVTTSVPLAPEAEKQTAPEVRKVMKDGKIYILRGEEVYTITGQRVR